MKQSFGDDFDDEPAQIKSAHTQYEPFAAFHWDVRRGDTRGDIPLDGVQVLIGHDVVVIHEFSIRPEGDDYSDLGPRQFAEAPVLSAALFTASLDEYSGHGSLARATADGWEEDEFVAAHRPKIAASLRCAIRADERRYRACLLVSDSAAAGAGPEPRAPAAELAGHVHASAFVKHLSTLLINDAKVRYEYYVADRMHDDLKEMLRARAEQADALAERYYSRDPSFSRAAVDALRLQQSDDRKKLDTFSKLVATFGLNAKQFEDVASGLLADGSPWVLGARRQIGTFKKNLEDAKELLRGSFTTTEEQLDNLWRSAEISDEEQRASERELETLRDRILDCYNHCNRCFGAILKNQLLFRDLKGESINLFLRVIPTPVTSLEEFKSFISKLYIVFDDSVQSDVRSPEKRWKLPEQLLQVAEVMDSKAYRPLATLRHRAVHATEEAKATWELAEVYEKLIGIRIIHPDDSQSWLQLQKAVLKLLLKMLEDVLQVFEPSRGGRLAGTGDAALGS